MCLAILLGIFLIYPTVFAQSDSVTAIVQISVCGNEVAEGGEECDNNDFASQTCGTFGHNTGSLNCNADCTISSSGCSTVTSPGGGGGGGGGGGSSYTPPAQTPTVTQVNFFGKAYPNRTVTLLKDAQVAATTVAGADASFNLSLNNFSSGNYVFSLYSEDKAGRRSSLLSFPVGLTQGATTNISGIFIAPTVATDKTECKLGDNLVIFGQSVPNSQITININSENEIFTKINADNSGAYLFNFDTSLINKGNHYVKAKASINNEISSFGKAITFKVGDKTTLTKDEPILIESKADGNKDGRVNLVDFSITAYWYQRPSPPAEVDLNDDGKVNLVDLSIMAYYWTG